MSIFLFMILEKNVYATHEVFYLRTRKHKLWNKYMCSNSSIDLQYYSQIRSKLHKLMRTLHNVSDQHTYLGVIIHKSLSWSPHISDIVTKASRTLHFIKLKSS